MRVLTMGLAVGMWAGAACGAQDASGIARGPARISGGVMAGQILTKVAPVYPEEAKAQGVQGTVVLHAVIGRDGAIESLQMVSGPEMLRASAWEAVKQWVYKPYLLNGQPTEVDTVITVNYSLGNGPGSTGGVPGGNGSPTRPPAISWQDRDPDAPVRISGGVMAGRILTKGTPVYPVEARAESVSGAVVLHAQIGKDGVVTKLEAISGPEMLRISTMDAVRQWTYKPYLLNGEPVAVDTTIMVNYQIGAPLVSAAEPR